MEQKNILLCVTGGIAVYKAVALTSKLTQAGFNVKVMMTDAAREFVQPLSFQVMSKNDVFYDTFDEKDSRVIAHIDLADWADLVIVAPATANTLAKLAHGFADNMVTTTLLATQAPVWLAPAMNVHMYQHPAVLRNIEQLHRDGYRFIEPSEGYLACGYVGKGRLEEPEKITALVTAHFANQEQAKVLLVSGQASLLAQKIASYFAQAKQPLTVVNNEPLAVAHPLVEEVTTSVEEMTPYVLAWQNEHPTGIVISADVTEDIMLPFAIIVKNLDGAKRILARIQEGGQ